jgi:threonine-phosphate decarboxylase
MISFESNLNFIGPPPDVEALVSENIAYILGNYVLPKSDILPESFAQYFDAQENCFAFGNGSTEIIFNVAHLLPRLPAVTLNPTFWEYTVVNERIGNNITGLPVRLDSLPVVDMHNLNDMLVTTPSNVFLCNPNNPTSTLIDSDDVQDIAENHPDSNFVVDETYLFFREDFDNLSLTQTATVIPNLHIVHSLSKFFACPGIRLGALVSTPDFVDQYRQSTTPFLLSPLAEVVGPWLLEQTEYISSSRQQHDQSRELVWQLFAQGLEGAFDLAKPEANFIFAKALFDPKVPITSTLSERKMVVRDGNVFGSEYSDFIRFCIRDNQDNQKLLEALQDISSEANSL